MQVYAQSKLCAATRLCDPDVFPLVLVFILLPGFTVAFLIIFFSGRRFLYQRPPGLQTLSALCLLLPLFTIVCSALLAGPLMVLPVLGWFLLW